MRTSITALAWLAASVTAASGQSADIGHELYNQYCATCHGEAGAGNGPLAEYITRTPTDLRKLTEMNDGSFPMLEVLHIIDGRTGVRAHGGPMPTYGEIFSLETQDDFGLTGSVIETRGRILSLALYLESLQE